MARYIDADKLKIHYGWLDEDSKLRKKDVDVIIDLQPTVFIPDDFVSCVNCVHWNCNSSHKTNYCDLSEMRMNAYDYCSLWERRLKEMEMCRNKKSDCFACKNGKCMILNNTIFGKKNCPFYKTEDRLSAERRAVYGKLIADCRKYSK